MCPEYKDSQNIVQNSYKVSIESSSWFTVDFIINIFKKYEGFIYQEDLCESVFVDLLSSIDKPNTLKIKMIGNHDGVEVVSELDGKIK